MEHPEIIQTAWTLCRTHGEKAELEADSLVFLFTQIGADQAARLWRDIARLVRTIQQNDAKAILH